MSPLSLLAALPALALAADLPRDPLVDTLITDLSHYQTELHLADAPPIYHLRYHLLRLAQLDAEASFGALVSTNQVPFNALAVEVRLGSPELDNTNFGGWQTGFARAWVPMELTPHALRLAAWRLTDDAYKAGVEQYARKSAQFTPPPDYPGDYQLLAAPIVADYGLPSSQPTGGLLDLAREVSAALAAAPEVELASVYVGHEVGSQWTVDTEGSRVHTPTSETSVRAAVHVRAEDGALLTDSLLWSVSDVSRLPSDSAMTAQAKAVADALVLSAKAEPLDAEYVGPVIFEDGAAVDLFRYLLLPQLEGTPGEIPFDTWLGNLGDSNDPVRLHRRVLPQGWDVRDDPQLDPQHPAAMRHDTEGTPTVAVELVDDGIVRDVLMTRTPRTGVEGTNGHARGLVGHRMSAHATQLTVHAAHPVSVRRLHQLGLKLAADYDRDYVLVVHRLQEPAIQRLSTENFPISNGLSLPSPVSVVRL